MPELNELIFTAFVHTKPTEKCPFCPPQARKGYKTYAGAANDSTKLESIMNEPSTLPSNKQSGARPQTGKEEDGWLVEQVGPPKPRKKNEKKTYTFQAHHLISGKQAMEGEEIENWIKASSVNEKDTGYSINNTNNGFWAPSVPKKYVNRWSNRKGVLNDQERQDLAEDIMDDFGAQIHIGPHNISDPDDPQGDKHPSYDRYLKKKLKLISDHVTVWAQKCKCGPQQNPPQVTHHIHNNLDNLSSHMKRKITGARGNWEVFLSEYALEYHKPVCKHERKKLGRRR